MLMAVKFLYFFLILGVKIKNNNNNYEITKISEL